MALVEPTDLMDQANEAISRGVGYMQLAANVALNSNQIDETRWAFVAPEVSFSMPTNPGSFNKAVELQPFSAELSLSDVYIPDTSVAYPDAPDPLDTDELFAMDRPVFNVDSTGLDAPTVHLPDVPDAPAVSMPTLDETPSTGLEAPEITVPGFSAYFDGVEPGSIAGVPDAFKADAADAKAQAMAELNAAGDAFVARYCPQYQSAMSMLEQRIANVMNGSEAALTDSIEEQIYQRGKSRVLDERFAAERQATTALSKRGFASPPGAMQAALQQAVDTAIRAVAGVASETAINRVQVELNHLQFTLNLSTQVRQAVMQAVLQAQSNAIAGLGYSVDYARQVAAFTVEAYNAGLQLYRLKLDLYRAKADVYKVELESAFAELRRFEALVELEKLKVDLDRNAIALYQAKIEGERSKIQLYIAQLQGVQSVAEIERSKVEVFRARVQAYAAQVQGKEAEFGAYTASVNGDRARVQAFSEQVNAYRAQIDAIKTRHDADRIKSDIINQNNRALVDVFDAQVRQYEAEMRAKGMVFSSEKDAYVAAIDAYRAEIAGRAEHARVALNESEQNLRAQSAQEEIDARIRIARQELAQSGREAAAKIIMEGARNESNIASSALSAISAITVEELDGAAGA